MPSTLALGLLVAGCAPPVALGDEAFPTHDPERSEALSLGALTPVPQPDLPAPLRPHASAAMHSAMHSAPAAAHGHAAAAPAPLAEALVAYLAIGDALSSDDLAPVAGHAEAFLREWERAVATPPAHAPHFWHRRAEAAERVRQSAGRLTAATTLEAARAAFGDASVPLAELIDAHGPPDGFGLVRHVCGMRPDLPEGGVWLQREGPPRNPYFGSRMLACAVEAETLPSRAADLHPAAPPHE
ncbi:MAG TPA: DUF3347 domain-containing protein [Bacteroidetes bacterium]|nr:DUF3347 domain-containing protein [Bacteroidota bacterium]